MTRFTSNYHHLYLQNVFVFRLAKTFNPKSIKTLMNEWAKISNGLLHGRSFHYCYMEARHKFSAVLEWSYDLESHQPVGNWCFESKTGWIVYLEQVLHVVGIKKKNPSNKKRNFLLKFIKHLFYRVASRVCVRCEPMTCFTWGWFIKCSRLSETCLSLARPTRRFCERSCFHAGWTSAPLPGTYAV